MSSSGDDENPFVSNANGGVSSVVTSPAGLPSGTAVGNPENGASSGAFPSGGQENGNPFQSGGTPPTTTSPVGFNGEGNQQGVPFGSESSQGVPFGSASGQAIPTGTQSGGNGFPTTTGVSNPNGFGGNSQNGSPSVFPLPGSTGSSLGGSNPFSGSGSEGGYITTTLTIAIPIPTGGAHNASETARITHQNGGALGNAHLHGFTIVAAVVGAVVGAFLM